MQERKDYSHIMNHLIKSPDDATDIDIYNAGGQNPGGVDPEEALAILRGIHAYRQHKDFAKEVRRSFKNL